MYTTQECRGGSNTWGAYITKSDTTVQQEMMSREKKTGKTTPKYKENRHSLGMTGGRTSTLGTGYTSSLSHNGAESQ